MLEKLLNKKEKNPEKEKERLTLSVLISGTLFILGMVLIMLMSCSKK